MQKKQKQNSEWYNIYIFFAMGLRLFDCQYKEVLQQKLMDTYLELFSVVQGPDCMVPKCTGLTDYVAWSTICAPYWLH